MQHFRMSHLYLSFTKAASSESQKNFGPVFGCVFSKRSGLSVNSDRPLVGHFLCCLAARGSTPFVVFTFENIGPNWTTRNEGKNVCVVERCSRRLVKFFPEPKGDCWAGQGSPRCLAQFFFSRTATGLPLAHHNETTKRWTVRRYSTPAMEHIMKLRNTDQPKYTYVLYIYVMSMCIYRNIYEYTYIYIYIHLRVMKSRLNTRAHD